MDKQPADDEDDVRSRFIDPDDDERLRAVQRPGVIPDVPATEFERPKLRKPGEVEPGRAGRLSPVGNLNGMGIAGSIGITLVASIAVGAGLGWLVDHFLLHDPATPWGLIVGFLFGTASGFINLVRVATRLNRDDR